MEGGRAVGKSEEHNQRLIKSSVSAEGSFPFIAFLHPDIVKSPMDIEFGKIPSSTEFLNQFGYEGERVFIFNCDCVEGSIVLD